jgi:hypothetical protein
MGISNNEISFSDCATDDIIENDYATDDIIETTMRFHLNETVGSTY